MQKETRRNSAAGSAKPNPPRKLTRAEKKQIAEIIRQAKGDGKAHTAQQTIPYIQMYPDGICKVTGRKYSKTVAFEDINYQLAQADDNSDFVLMLNQAAGDRAILAKQLNISPQQMKYVTHTEAGEGLIFYGNVVLPFVDRFPKDTELYRVMTTKPEEVGEA